MDTRWSLATETTAEMVTVRIARTVCTVNTIEHLDAEDAFREPYRGSRALATMALNYLPAGTIELETLVAEKEVSSLAYLLL